ncbi:PAS domain-containing sensor histidine kinase [Algoriphagus persicinus]|uniref:PAS domain-containing sensor histidine kinase n=1 Tax=Algoriphagus persicinus TaxID=3108754 RepID=UPI002B3A617A|nr:ATP-binding protein [Algoriphagus sp. E1-3-M2]MEB2787356.1 PAS domain S-box protein [Algoriphagus sp. E1-3-M2]
MIDDYNIYEYIFRRLPDGVVICDSSGQILKINPAVGLIFGYTDDELIGKKINLFIPPELRANHDLYFRSYQANPSSRNMSQDMALPGIRKDGTTIFLGISINILPSKDQNNLYLAIIRDTTQFKLKSQELEKNTIQLQEALQLSKMGHWEYDLIKDKLTWSREVFEIFELDPNIFFPSNEKFINLVFEEDKEYVIKSFSDSVLNQIPYNIVHRYITPTNHLKFLRERGKNLYNSEGIVIKSIGTVQDVTEVQKQKVLLNEYINKIEKKNKELEEFTYIDSHDLQEPISNIKGIVALLKSETKSNDYCEQDIDQYINLILEASNKISNLIKGLMETNRLGQKSQITELDCNELVKDAISNLANQIKRKNATIIISNILPNIMGLEYEITLLFQNLISNGLKFSKNNVNPILRISSHDQGPTLLFMVEDNGIGIDPKYKDKLFKMFRRLHVQSEFEGTGIGLVQCKKIVEQHNGEIWFESEPNKGTIFYFTIRKPYAP